MEAVNSIRLECGTPWFGADYDDKQIPHEAGLEHSHINYEKGCYTGQEIVERVRSRGHVNRRLTELRFGGEAPAPGTKLLFGGNEVGSVTSSAFSPTLGQADWSWAICGASTPPLEHAWTFQGSPRKSSSLLS